MPHRDAVKARALVFVPDLASIEKPILADNRRMRLAVVDSPGVDGSALHDLRQVGVKSLAQYIGGPKQLTLIGDSEAAPELDQEMDKLRSSRTRNHLKTILPRHGVPGEALERSWRSMLKELRGARVAPQLEAVYRLGRHTYSAPIEGGYDPATKQICVASGSALMIAFYDAVASRIFVQGAPISHAHGLYHAVQDIASSLAARTLFDDVLAPDGDDGNQSNEGEHGPDEVDDSGPDNRKGHGKPPDVAPFVPNPASLEKPEELTFPKGRKKPKRSRREASTDDRRHSLEEDAQIEKLKNDHYAVHCQACIGGMDVLDAAPLGTYVYSPHFRRPFIEAHHVKLLANIVSPKRRNEVAGQGAANILILCQYHHRLLGDLLSRSMVIESLRNASKTVRHFPDNAGATVAKAGLVARITLPAEPYKISLFFTRQHRDAWLDVSS